MSESEEETVEKQLKIIFVGEPNVGKSSIIRRFCYDDFTRQYTQTLGADFYVKRVILPGRKEVSVKITEIGGLEMNGPMLGNYLFNSDMIVLVYDITNFSSFERLFLWIQHISKYKEDPPLVAVLGNKCDLEHKRVVRLDQTQNFVEKFQLYNFLVSAKTGENVNLHLTDLIARQFGVPLSKLEREKQSTVLKAELVPATPVQVKSNAAVQSNSTVCCIQ
ncbi:ras-related protein Rab-28-like [Anoplophora glabripennis]|uniref:ras-related protein Rab-28-like n=1 Tax=Anoplophora glabripennis TaxID=217634 RepID=UPI0008751762|nr:ras-related protein Rab-28-like [Anoplophora glabripennis]